MSVGPGPNLAGGMVGCILACWPTLCDPHGCGSYCDPCALINGQPRDPCKCYCGPGGGGAGGGGGCCGGGGGVPGPRQACWTGDQPLQQSLTASAFAPADQAFAAVPLMVNRCQLPPSPGLQTPAAVPGSDSLYSQRVQAMVGPPTSAGASNIWLTCAETGVSLLAPCAPVTFYHSSGGTKHYSTPGGTGNMCASPPNGAVFSSGSASGTVPNFVPVWVNKL